MSSSLTAGNILYPRMTRTSPDVTAPLGSRLIDSTGFWTPSVVYFLYTEYAELIPVLGPLHYSFQQPEIIFLFIPILLMWHLRREVFQTSHFKKDLPSAMLNAITWFYLASSTYYYVKIIKVFVYLPLPVSPPTKMEVDQRPPSYSF